MLSCAVWCDIVMCSGCNFTIYMACLPDSTFFGGVLVCEQAYSMAQNLDPSSEGRGVLQFKTGLMSVIKVPSSTSIVLQFLN